MITDLQLEDKKDSPISQLSGGMKRKLRYILDNSMCAHASVWWEIVSSSQD